MKQLLITIAAVLLLGCGKSVPEISIYDAAEKGDIAALEKHIVSGTNVNGFLGGWSCLDRASHGGHLEVVRLLLDNGTNVNARIEGLFDHPGKSPLDYSNENNHKEISELLLKHDGKTSDELDATGN